MTSKCPGCGADVKAPPVPLELQDELGPELGELTYHKCGWSKKNGNPIPLERAEKAYDQSLGCDRGMAMIRIAEHIENAVLAERERCAKIVDEARLQPMDLRSIVARIRGGP